MRSVRRRTAAVLGVVLLSGFCASIAVWWASTHHSPTVPVDPSAVRPYPPGASATPLASATPPAPPARPVHTDSVTTDSVTTESNGRLVDAYLFFLAALSSHRARGAMNASGGLGHDPHHTTAPSHAEP